MEIKLERFANRWRPSVNRAYCIGRLYVNGEYFCNTLEHYDFGFDSLSDPLAIKQQKRVHLTAIPVGAYTIAMHIHSPRFGQVNFYKLHCCGFLPRLMGVPGFDGVLIHAGNTEKDTEGCILVGNNSAVGMVTESRDTFLRLYKRMKEAARAYEGIRLTITRTYPCTRN